MRAIAAASNVDAALIHHFYLSKEGIFSAAIEDAFDPEIVVNDVLEVGNVHQRGERLLRVFLKTWESPERRDPLTAVLRSAMSHPDAARLLGDFISARVLARIVKATSPNQEDLRAVLIGSQLIGLGMLRFVLKLEPLSSASDEQVVTSIAPTIQRYLTGDIGPVPPVHTEPPNSSDPAD
jgi:AcrR family transcriptional regulator